MVEPLCLNVKVFTVVVIQKFRKFLRSLYTYCRYQTCGTGAVSPDSGGLWISLHHRVDRWAPQEDRYQRKHNIKHVKRRTKFI